VLADRHGDKRTDTTRSSQYFAAQFVSISQVIGCEDRLRNDVYCVEWGVKLYSNQRSPAAAAGQRRRNDDDDDANIAPASNDTRIRVKEVSSLTTLYTNEECRRRGNWV